MKIIRMTERDLDDVIRIERESFKEDAWSYDLFESELTRPNASYYSCFNGENQLIAYGAFHIIFDEAEILTLAVDANERGKGLGSKLLDEFISIWKDNNIRNAYLEVRVSNDQAINLYKKYGFQIIAIRNQYYKNKEDAFVMGLNL